MRILPQQGVFFMKGLKKKIILFLLMIVMGVSPVFANMPVIDITSIMQAIQGYVQSLQQWQAQLQQWKSEFDRIQKAAQGLASGDFTQVVSSIASLSKQASSWKLSEDMISDAYISNALSKTSDGSYSLLSMLNNSQLLVKKFDTFLDVIQTNAEKTREKIGEMAEAGNGLGAVGAWGSGGMEMSSSIVTMLMNILKSGGNIAKDFGNMWNDFATMFDVSPEEYAKIYREILVESLEGAIPGAKKSEDVFAAMQKQQEVIATAKQELTGLNAEEQGNAYAQALRKIEDAEKLYEDYSELYKWAVQMETAIHQIEGTQQEYDDAMKAAETDRARSIANKNMRDAMDKLADRYDAEARKGLEVAQEGLDAAFGVTHWWEEQ